MKPLRSLKHQKEILNTISYFSFFSYAPDFEQIYTFFPLKVEKNRLLQALQAMTASKRLISRRLKENKSAADYPDNPITSAPNRLNSYAYTVPQYSIYLKNRAVRKAVTSRKLRSVSLYLRTLSLFPVIRFIGLSGSAAMNNCKEAADVDLCIVTRRNLLFTGRFLAILLAALFGVRDLRHGVCLNLFFDERELAVPREKRTAFVAHEVLQLKPLTDKEGIYRRFRWANRWTEAFFPNAACSRFGNSSPQAGWPVRLWQPAETLLKKMQLAIIRKNRTGRLITPTQLWLFAEDHGPKVMTAPHPPSSSR